MNDDKGVHQSATNSWLDSLTGYSFLGPFVVGSIIFLSPKRVRERVKSANLLLFAMGKTDSQVGPTDRQAEALRSSSCPQARHSVIHFAKLLCICLWRSLIEISSFGIRILLENNFRPRDMHCHWWWWMLWPYYVQPLITIHLIVNNSSSGGGGGTRL